MAMAKRQKREEPLKIEQRKGLKPLFSCLWSQPTLTHHGCVILNFS